MKQMAVLSMALGMAVVAPVWAHEDGHASTTRPTSASSAEKTFGRAGDPNKVSRSVRIEMSDAMRYAPAEIRVRRAETIRIVAHNHGKVLHEIVLGTLQDLEEHAAVMRRHPGMEHHEPHMLHVAAGRTGELVWQFTRPGEYLYGCLIPGHFEAGMVGRIIVE